jgi:hypothetical protein
MSNVVNNEYPGKNPAEMSNAELAQLAAQQYQAIFLQLKRVRR